jgi:uncharacterized protein YbjT (DUF2867 family)
MSASTVLVYGAAGYTGRLIVERARARGLRPILATPGAVKPTIDRIKGAGVKALFPENIDLSVSSDGKAILVALARLKTKLSPNNPDGTYYSAGGTYGASLTWSKDVTISISATISATIG